MKTISVLDKNTIDKIAAGEVIERPSSIVKELVENAIDAGSNAVTVEIKDGGTTLVRITDNGEGIAPSEVKKPLCATPPARSRRRRIFSASLPWDSVERLFPVLRRFARWSLLPRRQES
ncbi:MAG: ATP-binding protein [Lachnospiraceae bacterium]